MAVKPWQQAAILAAITIAVFSSTLFSQFVYDARLQILTDPFLLNPWHWLDVLSLRVLRMDVLDFNRPVQLASLMLDAAVWGKEPFGYHFTSVVLHAINTVLVWIVMQGIVGKGGLSCMLAAILFAVHPVVTEAVCEPTFREDLLVVTFSLGSLAIAMRHHAAEPHNAVRANSDGWRIVACAAGCFLAAASKESGIVSPLILGMYWATFRRKEPAGFWLAAIGSGTVLVGGFLTARFLLEPHPSAIFESKPSYPGGSLAAAMMIEPQILCLYAQLIVFPVNLCADYGLYSIRHLPLPGALSILVILVAAGICAVRSDRRMAMALAILLLPLLPVSNLIPIYRAAADRYLYFPLAGVAITIALLLDSQWLRSRERMREAALVGCMGAIALLGMACVERQKVWATSLALWEDTYRKNPAAYTAAFGLGEALREVGRLPEAEKAMREAIRLSKEQRGDAWAMLSLILDDQGREAEARETLQKAIHVDPKLADPEGRVRALAMEQTVAADLLRLIKKTEVRRLRAGQ